MEKQRPYLTPKELDLARRAVKQDLHPESGVTVDELGHRMFEAIAKQRVKSSSNDQVGKKAEPAIRESKPLSFSRRPFHIGSTV